MGKVFIEKLFRVTEFDKLYLLMRSKKGKNPKDRLVDLFANPVSRFVQLELFKNLNSIFNFTLSFSRCSKRIKL